MRESDGKIPPGKLWEANLFRQQQLAAQTTVTISSNSVKPVAMVLPSSAWTAIGPRNVGGRTRSLIIDPADPSYKTLYAGAVDGGVWKTTDGGQSWTNLRHFMANLAVMTLAIDPNNHATIYAGTGEFLYSRGDGINGAGVFQSTNGGQDWAQLPGTATLTAVPRIAVSSTGTILAAGTGGIYQNANAGQGSWALTYPCTSSSTNICLAYDVLFDVNDSHTAMAVVLTYDTNTWHHKIIRSTNDGRDWTEATLPIAMTDYLNDHAELAYSKLEPGVVYANVSANGNKNGGQLWRSPDAGATFYNVMTQGYTGCWAGACSIWVSPSDPSLIMLGGPDVMRATCNESPCTSHTYTVALIGSPHGYGPSVNADGDVHADEHMILSSPDYPGPNSAVYLATDGGVFKTTTIATAGIGTHSWTSLNNGYQTAQYWDAEGIPRNNGFYIGGAVDNGVLVNPDGNASASLFTDGDGIYVAVDPTSPNYLYGTIQNLWLQRSTQFGPPYSVSNIYGDMTGANTGLAAFAAPILLDQRNPGTMLAATQLLYRSTNVRTGSPPTWSQLRGNARGALTYIATTPADPNVIWVAETGGTPSTGRGAVDRTLNGTNSSPTWCTQSNGQPGLRDQTSNDGMPKLPVTSIYIDPDDAAIVYLTFGGYATDRVWMTSNGKAPSPSFVSISSESNNQLDWLPSAPARCIVRHPRNPSVLFVGTDVGLYESDDGGAHWAPTDAGSGSAAVYHLSFVYGSDTLLVATHGLGLWAIDTSSTVTTFAPSSIGAQTQSSASIAINWSSYPNATGYELLRSSDGANYATIPVGTNSCSTSCVYTDSGLTANTGYLYRVRAILASGKTGLSKIAFATTVPFSNIGVGPDAFIKVDHMNQLRTAANALLTTLGLPLAVFDTAGTNTPVRVKDVMDVRTAIINIYAGLRLPIPTFSSVLTPLQTPISSTHLVELQNKLKQQ